MFRASSAHHIKLCDAKQVYHYKNMKLKLYKYNAAVWFNKTCNPTYDILCVCVYTKTPRLNVRQTHRL